MNTTSIREVLSYNKKITDISSNKLKPTDITDISNINTPVKCSFENDQLYEYLPDLVNRKFRPWFCKQFYRLGRERVLQLAAVARADSNCPPKLFAKLLKEA